MRTLCHVVIRLALQQLICLPAFAEQSVLIESLTTALAKVKREKAKLAESVPLAAVVDKQPTREERTVQELEKSVREQARVIKDQLKTSQSDGTARFAGCQC